MSDVKLIIVRNPFNRAERDERVLDLATMPTLAEVAGHLVPNGDVEVAVSVNGEVITADEWAARALRPGDQVVVAPVVAGDDGIGGIILSLAVMQFAPWAAGLINTSLSLGLTAGTFGMTLLTAGVGLVGSMLVGALVGPSRPTLPSRSLQSYDASPAYGWQPFTTQEPGGPIVRAYGTTKLYGNIIAGYIENTGDTGRQQVAHLLIDLGLGPYSALRDFKLNDQPIGYYSGVTVETRMGYVDNGLIAAFNDTQSTHAIGAKVAKGSPITRDTVGDDYDALEIVLTAPNGLWYANDSGGLNAVSVAMAVEISADGGKTWRHVATTPRTVSSVSPGYWSLGYWSENSGWSEGLQTSWYEYQRGSAVRTDHTDGEIGATWYTWRWMDVPTTIYTTVDDSVTLSAATQQPVRRTLRAERLTRGVRYKVRVTNLSDDQTSSRYGDDVYLAEINEVLYDDFQYPRTVLAAVRALATEQISGSIKFSCVADAALVRVWNGSAWVIEHSRNPAWICFDILTQPVFGIIYSEAWVDGFLVRSPYPDTLDVVRYDGYDPSRLILSEFYAWAQFCDALVPDGAGGTEPRCCWDGVFDTQSSVWDAALEVAATARAVLVPRGTRIGVVVDAVRAGPAQLFTVGNTSVKGFKETWLPMADRACAVEIEYLDAANDYARDKLTVVNGDVTEAAAQRVQKALRGVTRSSQAWREAMVQLKRNELIQRSGELGVDIDSLACQVGDLIWLQSDLTRWGEGGRLVSGTTTSVVLDHAVTLDSGKTYELKLRLADDTLLSRTITTPAGTVTTLAFATALPSAPSQFDPWAVGEVGKAVKEFIVTDIARDGEQRARLSLVEYNATLYRIDDGWLTLPTPDISTRPPAPAIGALRVEEGMERLTDGTINVFLRVDFERNESVGDVLVTLNNTQPQRVRGGWARFDGVSSGQTYTVAAQPFSLLGQTAPDSAMRTASVTVVGKIAPPADVAWFSAEGRNLSWGDVPDLDLAGYRLRWIPGASSDWGQAQPLHDGLVTASPWTMPAIPVGTATLLIKAVDTSGNESNAPAMVVVDLGDPLIANIITTRALKDDGFPGQLGGGAVSGGNLLAASTNSIWNPNDAALMWSADAASPMWGLTYYQALTYRTTITVAAGEVGSQMTIASTIAGDAWRLEYRRPVGDAALMWGATDTPMWSDDSAPMRGNAPGYVPWPGAITAEAGDYEIRVRTAFGRSRGSITALAVNFDVPDITEYLHDVAIAGGGTRLAPTKSYHAIRAVHLTLQDDGGSARTARVMDKSLAGPLIKAFDSSNAATTGHVDAIIQGY